MTSGGERNPFHKFTTSCLFRSRVPEWEGPHINMELLQLLKKFEEAGSTITIKYHEIGTGGCPVRSLGSLTDFEKWLKDVQKKQIAKGVPLKVIT